MYIIECVLCGDFTQFNNMIQKNSGVRDNKFTQSDSYNLLCHIRPDGETWIDMTTSQLDIVNIDKSFIQIRLTMNVQLQTTTTSAYSYDVVNSNYCYVFVGLKSGIQVFDQYTIFCNGNVTGCDQNRTIYENFVSMTQKPYDETKSRRNMYTTFENTWNYSKDVCGYYVRLSLLKSGTASYPSVPISFDVVVQYDDFLPLQFIQLYPNFVLGALTMKIRQRIRHSLVWCMVDPNKVISKDFNNASSQFSNMTNPSERRFSAVGDYMTIGIPHINNNTTPSVNILEGWSVTINATDCNIDQCRSNLHGFNIKASTKQQLIEMFNTTPLVIPAQVVNYYGLSQLPTTSGLNCNINIPMSNVTNVLFFFP